MPHYEKSFPERQGLCIQRKEEMSGWSISVKGAKEEIYNNKNK